MGCDIHLFVETRSVDGWQPVGTEGEYWSDRSYLLFAYLAGCPERRDR